MSRTLDIYRENDYINQNSCGEILLQKNFSEREYVGKFMFETSADAIVSSQGIH